MADIRALFFDMDGVIIDTERDGHRVAFNTAFSHFGYPFEWDENRYHQLLQVAGGKERMKHFFAEEGLFADLSAAEMDDFLKKLHAFKTSVFVKMIESASLPLRPGIRRFMGEAQGLGLSVCICTTSTEKTARTIAQTMLPEITFAHILAGDVVRRKKPDPEIYNLALEKTGLNSACCLVVEDSAIGVQAAKAAGIRVIATTNGYTEQEDLSRADIIVSTLGDANGRRGVLQSANPGLDYDGILYLANVLEYFGS